MVKSVIVVGSANQDYVIAADAMPIAGETRLAHSLKKFPGGKGANQAVACARLGAMVNFVGGVGDDVDGALIIRELRAESIDTSEIEINSSAATGIAIVTVLPGGDNSIMVVPGANFRLSPARIENALRRIAGPETIMVIQGEIPVEVMDAAVATADELGARVVVNLAPFVNVQPGTLRAADPLVLNEFEAAELTGYAVGGIELATRAALEIAARARSVVITLGAEGAVWAADERSGHVPALRVDTVVDTTGAGDAFIGALAAMFTTDTPLERAVRVGVEVGALAIAKVGAQASYPYRDEVRQLTATSSLDESSIQ